MTFILLQNQGPDFSKTVLVNLEYVHQCPLASISSCLKNQLNLVLLLFFSLDKDISHQLISWTILFLILKWLSKQIMLSYLMSNGDNSKIRKCYPAVFFPCAFHLLSTNEGSVLRFKRKKLRTVALPCTEHCLFFLVDFTHF